MGAGVYENDEVLYNKSEGVPWHATNCVPIDEPCSPSEAQKRVLDWDVEKLPSYLQQKDGSFTKIPEKFATARFDKKSGLYLPLGVVGKDYKVVQNSEAAAVLDVLCNEGGIKIHTAGSLFDGRRIWMLGRFGKTTMIVPKDIVDRNILLANSHDGSGALVLLITSIRVVCWNTFQAALRSARSDTKKAAKSANKRQYAFHIRHSGDPQQKLEEARRVLGIIDDTFQKQEELFKMLSQISVSDDQAMDGFKEMIPDPEAPTNPARAINKRTALKGLWDESPTIQMKGVRNTAWGFLNVWTEALDHGVLRGGNADTRLNSIFFGDSQKVKDAAVETILKVTGVEGSAWA